MAPASTEQHRGRTRRQAKSEPADEKGKWLNGPSESESLGKMRLSKRTLAVRFAQWVQAVIDTVVGFFLWLVSRPQRGKILPINDPLLLFSARELATAIRTGKLSSEHVVRAYMCRVYAVDPLVNAVVDQRYPEALVEAREADHYVQTSGKTPQEIAKEKPLLGVPVSVKSNIACKGMKHECGLVYRRGVRAQEDAEAVRLLREAGAIILLTSNVPELSTSYRAYNKINGDTRNPHDLARSSGGSTGGESALISSGASLIGLGNDMCGSLRMPACVTGVFAHKPTSGLVSTSGLYPPLEGFTTQMLVQGPMCRYAQDLELVLAILAGSNADKLRLNEEVDFKSLTFYYIDQELEMNYIPANENSQRSVKKVLQYFQQRYGSKVKQVSLPLLGLAMEMGGARCKSTAHRSYRSIMANHPDCHISLGKEVLKYMVGLSNHTIDSLLFAFLETQAPSKGTSESDRLIHKHEELQAQVGELLTENSVLIHPSGPETAYYSFETVSKFLIMQYFVPFNVLGLPVTQCPMGLSEDEYPLGVQVVAGKGQDRVTLAVAKELEEAFGGWCKPCEVGVEKDLTMIDREGVVNEKNCTRIYEGLEIGEKVDSFVVGGKIEEKAIPSKVDIQNI